MKVYYKILLITLLMPLTIVAQSRNDAGLQGDAGAVSGFYDASDPVNFPSAANGWWHLLDVRHSNPTNNYAMQFSGSFFDQQLFFRKTNDNASRPWSKVLLETDGKVGIGTSSPGSPLTIIEKGTGISFSPGGSPYYGTFAFNRETSTGIIFDPTGFAYQINNGGTDTNLHFQVWNGIGDLINNNALVIGSNGNIGINTPNPTERFSVNGKIRAHEIKVEVANWPDFVFSKGYKILTLEEIEKHIKQKGHLPEIPSAKDVKTNGIDLGEMNAKLLQKIEELTLYMIEIKNENKKLNERVNQLEFKSTK